ncbi:sialic acid-binding Ig-like lectin 5 isoform X2 [Desmodus rotundus]|uniref:sialic acid-binding Ig-like lectin 5 isoform X2 n=1 Tax=Desmodus rotundus TaxID=9430 RepID=UPI002380DDD5|nr:sialic acid-binding Ig-like lectin 5 isoform X2 [Desmodus rotundus]
MLLLLLLLWALLWAGSLAQDPGFRLQVLGSMTVQKGQCVSVPCTVIYPKIGWTDSTPAHGYWFQEGAKSGEDAPVATNNPNRKVQQETQGRFHLIGNPQTYDCSLHIRDARRRDTGRYFFRAERGSYVKQSYKENLLSVNVTSLTPTPDIHIQGTLESGHPKNITCTVSWDCGRETPPVFSWMWANFTLGLRTANSSVLTLTPGPQHHGTNLTCRAALQGGKIRERTVQLNVTYPPQLQGPSCSWEDKGLRCSCSSQAQPAPLLRWRLGEALLEGNHSNASYTITSCFAGPWANSSLSLYGELMSTLRLRCEAQNTHGKETVTVLLLPGRPGHRTGVIQGAVVGAGATALLAVCLGLIGLLLLRICRKKQEEKAESQEGVSQAQETPYSEIKIQK